MMYRILMRIAHRFNWHYAKPNRFIEPGSVYLWCKWCGMRDTTRILHDDKGHICNGNCIVKHKAK